MAYSKQSWTDGVSEANSVTLGHIEDGIGAAAATADAAETPDGAQAKADAAEADANSYTDTGLALKQDAAFLDADVTALADDSGSALATSLSATIATAEEFTATPNFPAAFTSRDPLGSTGIIAKQTGDTSAGLLNWQHDGDSGYLLHLTSGANFDGDAIMAIGHDNGGHPGLLVVNKDAGVGIQVTNQETVTSPVSYGFYLRQSALFSPGMVLEQTTGAARGSVLDLVSDDTGDALPDTYSLMRWRDPAGTIMGRIDSVGALRLHDKSSTVRTFVDVADEEALADNVRRHTILHKSGVEFYNYSGTPGTWFPFALRGQANNLRFEVGSTTNTVGSPGTMFTLLQLQSGSKMGFFGATPVLKPTGVGVDAASIHAALVSLGLIGV